MTINDNEPRARYQEVFDHVIEIDPGPIPGPSPFAYVRVAVMDPAEGVGVGRHVRVGIAEGEDAMSLILNAEQLRELAEAAESARKFLAPPAATSR